MDRPPLPPPPPPPPPPPSQRTFAEEEYKSMTTQGMVEGTAMCPPRHPYYRPSVPLDSERPNFVEGEKKQSFAENWIYMSGGNFGDRPSHPYSLASVPQDSGPPKFFFEGEQKQTFSEDQKDGPPESFSGRPNHPYYRQSVAQDSGPQHSFDGERKQSFSQDRVDGPSESFSGLPNYLYNRPSAPQDSAPPKFSFEGEQKQSFSQDRVDGPLKNFSGLPNHLYNRPSVPQDSGPPQFSFEREQRQSFSQDRVDKQPESFINSSNYPYGRPIIPQYNGPCKFAFEGEQNQSFSEGRVDGPPESFNGHPNPSYCHSSVPQDSGPPRFFSEVEQKEPFSEAKANGPGYLNDSQYPPYHRPGLAQSSAPQPLLSKEGQKPFYSEARVGESVHFSGRPNYLYSRSNIAQQCEPPRFFAQGEQTPWFSEAVTNGPSPISHSALNAPLLPEPVVERKKRSYFEDSESFGQPSEKRQGFAPNNGSPLLPDGSWRRPDTGNAIRTHHPSQSAGYFSNPPPRFTPLPNYKYQPLRRQQSSHGFFDGNVHRPVNATDNWRPHCQSKKTPDVNYNHAKDHGFFNESSSWRKPTFPSKTFTSFNSPRGSRGVQNRGGRPYVAPMTTGDQQSANLSSRATGDVANPQSIEIPEGVNSQSIEGKHEGACELLQPSSALSSGSLLVKCMDLKLPDRRPDFVTVASRVVWILELPDSCSQDELMQIMTDYGKVEEVYMDGKHFTAFVTMSTRGEAANLVHHVGKEFQVKGKRVKVCYGKGKGVEKHQGPNQWDGRKGVTYLPFDSIPLDLSGLVKQGYLDIASLPVTKRSTYNTDGTFKPTCSNVAITEGMSHDSLLVEHDEAAIRDTMDNLVQQREAMLNFESQLERSVYKYFTKIIRL